MISVHAGFRKVHRPVASVQPLLLLEDLRLAPGAAAEFAHEEHQEPDEADRSDTAIGVEGHRVGANRCQQLLDGNPHRNHERRVVHGAVGIDPLDAVDDAT